RSPASVGPGLQPAGALVEFHHTVARRSLGPARHRHVSDGCRLRVAAACRTVSGSLALELPVGGVARGARPARLGLRLGDPATAGYQRAVDVARHSGPRAGGGPRGAAGVHHRWATLPLGNLRRRPAATLRRVRQDSTRAAALSGSPAVPGRATGTPI